MIKAVENKSYREETKACDPDIDSKIFGANIINSPNKMVMKLDKGNIRSVFNLIKLNIDTYAIALASGINYRTIVKYDTGYYDYLNKEDTERLLKAINEMYLPSNLHFGLDRYTNIDYADYEPQDEYRKLERAEHREKIKKMVEEQNDHTPKDYKKRGYKTGGRAVKC